MYWHCAGSMVLMRSAPLAPGQSQIGPWRPETPQAWSSVALPVNSASLKLRCAPHPRVARAWIAGPMAWAQTISALPQTHPARSPSTPQSEQHRNEHHGHKHTRGTPYKAGMLKVNQMLCYLDGVEDRGRVYVVAASGRPDMVVLGETRGDARLLVRSVPARAGQVRLGQAVSRQVMPSQSTTGQVRPRQVTQGRAKTRFVSCTRQTAARRTAWDEATDASGSAGGTMQFRPQ